MAITLGSAYGKVEIDFTGIQRGVDAAGRSLTSLENRLKTTGAAVKQVGDNLSRDVTLPLVAVGAASYKMASDFEANMQQIVGLVGVSQDQVDAWSKQLITLGPELGRAPNELAKALYFVTSAGLSGQEALDTVTASAKAASAGLGETQIVADAVSSAINAFGKENLTAEQAVGVLVATVREGKAEASEIAPALGSVIPVAAQLGISFDEVGAALAAMTRVGFNAAEGATNLSGIMSAFLKPGKQASETMEKFGLSADEVRKTIDEKGLLVALRLIADRLGDDDEALAAIFPNIRGFRGLLSLVGENAEETEVIFSKLAQTTAKDLDTAFTVASKTAKFQMNQAMAELQSTLIVLGGAVLPAIVPVLKDIAAFLRDVAKAFQSLSPETQRAIVTILIFTAALGPVLSIGGRLIGTIGNVAGLVKTLGTAFIEGAGAAIKFASTGAQVVQYLIEAGVAGLAVVGAFAALAAALVIVIKFIEQAGVAAKATNDELIAMSRSGDLFMQAGASFELIVNGTKRINEVLAAHEREMRVVATSYGEYRTEVERAAKVAGYLVDAEGNLIKVTQGLGYETREVVQANYAMTESAYNLGVAQRTNEAIMDEGERALKGYATAAKETKEAVTELAEASMADMRITAIASGLAIEYTDKENALKDKLKELRDVEDEIAKRGVAHNAVVKNAKLSADERATAEARLAAVTEDVTLAQRKKNETDAEYTARMAGLKEKQGELTTKLGEHTVVVGGATKAQLEHRQAVLDDIAAMERSAEVDRARDAFDALGQALKAGTLTGEEYSARATALNNITHLYSTEALFAAMSQQQLISALTNPASANWQAELARNKTSLDGVANATLAAGGQLENFAGIQLPKTEEAGAAAARALGPLAKVVTDAKTAAAKKTEIAPVDVGDPRAALGPLADVGTQVKTTTDQSAAAFRGLMATVKDEGRKAQPALKPVGDAFNATEKQARTSTKGATDLTQGMINTIGSVVTERSPTLLTPLEIAFNQLQIKLGANISAIMTRLSNLIQKIQDLGNTPISIPSLPTVTGAGSTSIPTHPGRQQGGPTREGWHYLHDDEYVLSSAMRRGQQPIPAEALALTPRASGTGAPISGALGNTEWKITIAPVFNVTAAPGMDVDELAQRLSQRVGRLTQRAINNGQGWQGI